MRVPAFPIVASLVLFAAPAFAQSSTTTGAATEQSGITTPATGWHHGMGVSTDTKEKIRQSLEQSGFKNINVTPEAFVIHAQAPDGSRLVMLLRPDEMTGVVESGSSSEPSSSTSTGSGYNSNSNGSSTTESGTNR